MSRSSASKPWNKLTKPERIRRARYEIAARIRRAGYVRRFHERQYGYEGNDNSWWSTHRWIRTLWHLRNGKPGDESSFWESREYAWYKKATAPRWYWTAGVAGWARKHLGDEQLSAREYDTMRYNRAWNVRFPTP